MPAIPWKLLPRTDITKYDSIPMYMYTEKDGLNRVTVLKETSKEIYLVAGRYATSVPEGSLAAGGRAGGFGVRKIEKLYAFHYEDGSCRKLFEVDNPEKLESFELPYHAAGTPIIMPDGSERIISGVIDPEFVAGYKQIV